MTTQNATERIAERVADEARVMMAQAAKSAVSDPRNIANLIGYETSQAVFSIDQSPASYAAAFVRAAGIAMAAAIAFEREAEVQQPAREARTCR